jgi:esterase
MTAMRITGDGVGLHVEVDGPPDAPPVVFLHGVMSSGRTWEWLGPEVTRGRRIVRLDFRGHGRSDHAPGTYNVARYGSDVVAVLRALCDGTPAVLVGHSLGGVVAWWLAQSRPDLVAGAFLEDPPLLQGPMTAPENELTRLRFEAMREAVLADRREGRSEAEIARRLGSTPMGPPGAPRFEEIAFPDSVAAMAFGQSHLDVGVIDGAIDGSTLLGVEVLSPVAPPVQILAADDARGAAFTTDRATRLARAQPGVAIERVSGSGHGIHDECLHRAAFTESLHRFLDKLAPATVVPRAPA